MSDFDNPFEDPSVHDASQPVYPPVDDGFNPFAHQQQLQGETPKSSGVPPPQPATVEPTAPLPPAPAAYTSWERTAAADDLRRRQEELERKAAELERREQEMQRNLQLQDRKNNFPPLPSWCPVQPCFYQDLSVDIPLEFQRIVRMSYYFWIAYVALLLLNVVGSLTYFIASVQHSESNESGTTFGVSLLLLVLFVPCSFVCWFRPVYNAFQRDSSFNFFLFFFVFFFQFCVLIVQCLAIDGWGTVGIMNSLGMFHSASVGARAAATIMFLIGVMFGIAAAFNMIILLKVHRIYRSTGASFAKAQQEFSQGVLSNRSVQQTVGNAASAAARGAVDQSLNAGRN